MTDIPTVPLINGHFRANLRGSFYTNSYDKKNLKHREIEQLDKEWDNFLDESFLIIKGIIEKHLMTLVKHYSGIVNVTIQEKPAEVSSSYTKEQWYQWYPHLRGIYYEIFLPKVSWEDMTESETDDLKSKIELTIHMLRRDADQVTSDKRDCEYREDQKTLKAEDRKRLLAGEGEISLAVRAHQNKKFPDAVKVPPHAPDLHYKH